MEIKGIRVNAIDFRFEDWKRGYNPEKGRNVLMPKIGGQQFFVGNFSTPIDDSTWLNHGYVQPSTVGNLSLKMAAQPAPKITPEPLFQPLPPIWFDFAIFYDGNRVTKSPEWPRDEYESLS
jgi:hypothetical protein